MSRGDDVLEGIGGVVCLILVITIIAAPSCSIGHDWGQASGEDRAGEKWKQELVDRELAEYNTVTGEWQWKEKGDE